MTQPCEHSHDRQAGLSGPGLVRELEAALGQAVSLLDVLDFQDDAGYLPKFEALLTSKERLSIMSASS
jgi:hypothetical protein